MQKHRVGDTQQNSEKASAYRNTKAREEMGLSYAPPLRGLNIFRIFKSFWTSEDIFRSFAKSNDVVGLLGRSSWSLALIAIWRQKLRPDKIPIVWFPSYFCSDSMRPIKLLDIKIYFYPVKLDGQPNFEACRLAGKLSSPDIFILTHYWGEPKEAAVAAEFCKQHDCWLVEDCAHAMFRSKGLGEFGDFVLYSPHKHLPMPNGALLVIKKAGCSNIPTNFISKTIGDVSTWVGELESVSKQAKTSASLSFLSDLMWLVKRSITSFGAFPPRHPEFTAGEESSNRLPPASITFLSILILRSIHHLLPSFGFLKQSQALLVSKILCQSIFDDKIQLPLNDKDLQKHVPYHLTLRCNPASQLKLIGKFHELQIPAIRWPELPEKGQTPKSNFEQALEINNHSIFLPLQAGNDSRKFLCLKLGRNDTWKTTKIDLCWDSISESAWMDFYSDASNSNISQEWAYGVARSQMRASSIRRGAFFSNGRLIGLVQCFLVSYLGVKVHRISMGPIFRDGLSFDEIRSCYWQLSKLGNWRKGSMLSIAPWLEQKGKNLELLADCGFKQALKTGWQSKICTTYASLDESKRQLDVKWRGHLNKAKKSAIDVLITNDEVDFFWLVKQEFQAQEVKGYAGIHERLSTQYYKSSKQKNDFVILVARANEERVASIAIKLHGNTATYLLSWSNQRGREVRANFLLLWEAFGYLKANGIRYFDLGGIDEDNNKSVAQFKKGFLGVGYTLVGDFYKL